MTTLNGDHAHRVRVLIATCAGTRHRRGLTQDDIAARLGWTRYRVRQIEDGDVDPVAQAVDLWRYSLACGVHVTTLATSHSTADLLGSVLTFEFIREYQVRLCEEVHGRFVEHAAVIFTAPDGGQDLDILELDIPEPPDL